MILRHAINSLMMVLFTSVAFAVQPVQGTNSGGGGGGIKMPDGKIYTMAQAGLRFYENPQDPFYVDAKIMRQAKQILKDLEKHCIAGLYDTSCNNMIRALGAELSSNEHIYKKVEIVDPKLFDRVQKEYLKFVGKLPIKGKFVMAAYTDKKTTLLFPDFFGEGVDLQTQAIYLIHEALFSNNSNITLEKVLRVEVATVEILQEVNLRTVRQLRDAFAIATSGDQTPTNALIANYLEYLKDQGKTVSLNQLFEFEAFERTADINSNNYNDFIFFQTSPYTVSDNKDLDPEFFRTFFQKQMKISQVYSNGTGEMILSFNDLELRGVWLFNKKTGKKFEVNYPSIGRTYDFHIKTGYCYRDCLSFEEIKNEAKQK